MSDIAVLAHLAPVLEDAPSGPTVRRALDLAGGAAMLDRIARARARARADVWKLIEGTTAGFPWLEIAGKSLAGWLVIDMDATLVTAHWTRRERLRPGRKATASTHWGVVREYARVPGDAAPPGQRGWFQQVPQLIHSKGDVAVIAVHRQLERPPGRLPGLRTPTSSSSASNAPRLEQLSLQITRRLGHRVLEFNGYSSTRGGAKNGARPRSLWRTNILLRRERRVALVRWRKWAAGITARGDLTEISAQEILEFLRDQKDGQGHLFVGKRVTGPLDLTEKLIDHPLRFSQCEFTDVINLTGARAASGIHLDQCEMQSLCADRLSVRGDLVLERVRSAGSVSLRGARLTGHLRCTGSEFLPSAGPAFNGEGIVVSGSAMFDQGHAEGEFILTSARIGGNVDMEGAWLASKAGVALMAEGIRAGTGVFLSKGFKAEGAVRLAHAQVSGLLMCSGGQFCSSPAWPSVLDAQLIQADEICLDEGFEATGPVFLNGSTVTRRLTCDKGTFRNEGGIALSANGLYCRDMFLGRGFNAVGEVQLRGTTISNLLNCTKGTFNNQRERTALNADGLNCGGRIYLNETCITGGVQLLNARAKTELNCTNAFFNGKPTALNARGLACDGNVYLNESFNAAGSVKLIDAMVAGELNCEGGAFTKVDARRLAVGGEFSWQPKHVPQEVDVSFADVGLLMDNMNSWPAQEKTRLLGFTFRNIDGPATVQQRICWLKNASYTPDAFQQLSRIYRQKGQDGDAKKFSIAGQRDRRERGKLPLASKVWSRFLDFTVRYGHEMYRPLLAVLFFGVLGTILFYLAKWHNLMEPVAAGQPAADSHAASIEASKCTPDYPCFVPYAYAFEIFFPVINLRQLTYWLPSAATVEGSFLLVWVWAAIASGWALSVATAAGIGHLFSQRD